MSYTISISGHKETASEDESREFEQEQLDKARSFVGELDGVSTAYFSGGQVGGIDLTKATAEEETAQ